MDQPKFTYLSPELVKVEMASNPDKNAFPLKVGGAQARGCVCACMHVLRVRMHSTGIDQHMCTCTMHYSYSFRLFYSLWCIHPPPIAHPL